MPKGPSKLAVMIGAPSKGGADPGPDVDDGGEEEARQEAGLDLADAIAAKDGRAICEAVKTIMNLEYEDE